MNLPLYEKTDIIRIGDTGFWTPDLKIDGCQTYCPTLEEKNQMSSQEVFRGKDKSSTSNRQKKDALFRETRHLFMISLTAVYQIRD